MIKAKTEYKKQIKLYGKKYNFIGKLYIFVAKKIPEATGICFNLGCSQECFIIKTPQRYAKN
jgi:hypothetical protein